jgi:hypothetical protein
MHTTLYTLCDFIVGFCDIQSGDLVLMEWFIKVCCGWKKETFPSTFSTQQNDNNVEDVLFLGRNGEASGGAWERRLCVTRLKTINHLDVIVLCYVLILLLANLFTFYNKILSNLF